MIVVYFVLVAQWIEWKPPELQVVGSNPAEDVLMKRRQSYGSPDPPCCSKFFQHA